MIECDTCQEWISLWLDKRLNQSEVQQVEAHTATCVPCRVTLNGMRQVDQLLANTSMMAPAAGFTTRFQARLTARRRRRRTWAGLFVLSLGSLCVLMAMTLLVAVPGLALWENLSGSGLLVQGMALLIDLGKAWASLLGLGWLIVSAMAQVMRHPVFISYVVATSILTVFWTQVVKRRALVPRTATGTSRTLLL